jgi:uncharacterized membrane protein
MKPLLAILFPPGYFFVQGRPIAGVIHLGFWILSIILLFVMVGVFIWFIQASLACWDLRKQVMNEQATAIAEKMAEKFARTEPPSPT